MNGGNCMNGPDISVIVPCFNAERYLGTCLESLAVQKRPEIEMIFIDDGSTDGTGAILDRFSHAEPRAKVYHLANEGVSAARNRGIRLAKGQYIAFLDSDDAFEENALSILYKAARRTNADIISAN
ncbi:MAG: glycosyltransferase family 2 protein, partial [Clostridia bacterium]|nr:glycosyltransferase family 2 protein [Clostridia bacterium]